MSPFQSLFSMIPKPFLYQAYFALSLVREEIEAISQASNIPQHKKQQVRDQLKSVITEQIFIHLAKRHGLSTSIQTNGKGYQFVLLQVGALYLTISSLREEGTLPRYAKFRNNLAQQNNHLKNFPCSGSFRHPIQLNLYSQEQPAFSEKQSAYAIMGFDIREGKQLLQIGFPHPERRSYLDCFNVENELAHFDAPTNTEEVEVQLRTMIREEIQRTQAKDAQEEIQREQPEYVQEEVEPLLRNKPQDEAMNDKEEQDESKTIPRLSFKAT